MEHRKVCFKCGEDKPLSEYYKHKQMGDGHLNKCKCCTKKDVDEREKRLRNDDEWVESERKRHREKYFRLGYKEKHKPTYEQKKATMYRYNKKYPEKKKAMGRISHLKPINIGNHLHHWNYNDDYLKDVIEVTPSEHAKFHRFVDYDAELFVYKVKKSLGGFTIGDLLDSKQKHIEFLELTKDEE